jgi:IS30 family transposase
METSDLWFYDCLNLTFRSVVPKNPISVKICFWCYCDLVTIVDRVSKFTLIKKVDNKHAEVVTAATISLLQPYYLDKTLTITADNGKEFAGHETIKEQLGANVYFAHPYCSWERGLNENTNGLIRQYFTKGSSFENIIDDEVEAVMNKLNHRPRKSLKFKTPHTVFFADTLQEAP